MCNDFFLGYAVLLGTRLTEYLLQDNNTSNYITVRILDKVLALEIIHKRTWDTKWF